MNFHIEQNKKQQLLNNIHTGVKVKISSKNSRFIQSKFSSIPHDFKSDSVNRIETMIKRLWLESETSALSKQGEKPIEIIGTSSPINCIIKKNSLNLDLKRKNFNTIGIQTMKIEQIDRKISCQLIENNRSLSTSSISSSDTSTSTDNNSTQTETTSTISSNENPSHNSENTVQNNNAMNTHIERKISNNVENINSPMTISLTKKKHLFDRILNLIRSGWLKHAMHSHIENNENSEKIQSTKSRCRRSSVRNSIELDKNRLIHCMPLQSHSNEKQYSSKKLLKYNHAKHIDSYRSKKKRRNITRKKRSSYKNEISQTSFGLSYSKEKLPIVNQSLLLPDHAIRLRVRNKKLLPNRSKSVHSPSSSYHLDSAIEHHQNNLIDEFQSILYKKNII